MGGPYLGTTNDKDGNVIDVFGFGDEAEPERPNTQGGER